MLANKIPKKNSYSRRGHLLHVRVNGGGHDHLYLVLFNIILNNYSLYIYFIVSIINSNFCPTYASSLFSQYSSICFIGDGALKCEEFLGGEGRVFLEEYPCVESSIPLGHTAFISGNFVNLSSYEPNYLKAFQAGAAKDPFGLRKKLSL